MKSAPAWLSESAAITGLLSQFLDRLDKQPAAERQRPVVVTLNEKSIPTLFRQGAAADHLWDLIKSLQEDHAVIHITNDKRRDPFSPEYTRARLTLQAGGEDILRHWLQRPRGLSPLQRWRKAVEKNRHRFPGNTEKLSAHRIAVPGKEDEAVVAAFALLGNDSRQGLSLRQLSSRCFWGDSKFLDTREELIRELYPDLVIQLRPVIVNIFIPETIEGILFIENQDSYTSAIGGKLACCKDLILVYTAGFKGSAGRIRRPDGVSLHYHSQADQRTQQRLEDWWFERHSDGWPVWFWGDLDYSGMAILKALKQRFHDIRAWPPGYQSMLKLLQQQKGHAPAMAGKQAQQDPGTTGCEFADRLLLPAIRHEQAFIDQEAILY